MHTATIISLLVFALAGAAVMAAPAGRAESAALVITGLAGFASLFLLLATATS